MTAIRNLRSGVCLSSLFAVVMNLSGCIDSRGITPQADTFNDAGLVSDEAIRKAAEEARWPELQWWRAYKDPQLDSWIRQALEHSPDLAQARARVRLAESMAGVAASYEGAQLDFDAEVQRKRWPDDRFYGNPSIFPKRHSWNNSFNLRLVYDLDIWGQLRKNEQRALDMAKVVATEERAAALELAGNIVYAYIQMARYYAERDIVEDTLHQREELLELARKHLKMGLGTQLEVTEAEAPIPDVKRQLDMVEEGIALARNQLAALAGKGPGAAAVLKRPLLSLHVEPALPSSLPLELVGHRPDVVASRWQVAAEARGIEVAKADFYPNINLAAALGNISTQGGVLNFLGGPWMNALSTAMSLPVFDSGQRRGNLSAATARYDMAVEQYNQTLVMAVKEISDFLIELHSLHEQEEFIAEALETAHRRCELAEDAYRRGLTDYRRVLEAQTELFKQQRLREQIVAAHLATQAKLWVALGGGMLDDKDSRPAAEELKPRDVHLRNIFSLD